MRWNYKLEATRFGEANPIGNGHIGGMVYGSTVIDQIALSEATFFSGEKSENDNQPGAYHAFGQMREQIEAGSFVQAKETAEAFIGRRNNYGTNLPVGFLNIAYQNPEVVTEYSRSLDMEHGIVEIQYSGVKNRTNIQAFVSHPDKVMVYAVETKKPISCTVSFTREGNEYETDCYEDGFSFHLSALEQMHSDGTTGVSLTGHVLAETDGELICQDGMIQILNANYVELYLGMETNFDRPECEMKDLQEQLRHHLLDCRKKTLMGIEVAHKKDFSSFMDRMKFELTMPEERRARELVSMFQYGRYLLLSSSREDSKLPAHLQGIWNDNVACRIGWTCDMHLDINTQMNYWPAEVCNLSESAKPLFRYVEDRLVPSGRKTARESYNRQGWVAELVSNAWGFSAPYWAAPISPCPTGGLWVATHLWEHYLFSMDQQFLKEHAFPVLEEAVRFFVDYVFEDKQGKYSSGPSISPENSFVAEGQILQISNGCTYEILMIRELFEIFCKIVNEKSVISEEALYEKVAAIKDRLLPYRIREDGSIAEWNHDFPEADVQHRHTSHLLGLFPYSQITPEATPELAKAAVVTMNKKLSPPENWEDTGWARSMLMLYCARLQDGNAAYGHIEKMLQHLWESNHMIIHPPTRGAGSFDNVYELDGNTGLTSCIAEMLVQSHQNYIHLLPALPDQWLSGSISGLKARGNVEVEIQWQDGNLKHAYLTACFDGEYHVRYKNQIKVINLQKGTPEEIIF